MSTPLDGLEALAPLLSQLERLGDPRARAHAQAIVRAVLDFHAAGIERVLEVLRGAGATGDEIVEALTRDGLVGSMLILHGLHPQSLDARARAALEGPLPNGWRVDRVDVVDGGVRVAFARTGDPNRSADPARVRAWADSALERAVPDAEWIEWAGDLAPAEHDGGFVPVDRLLRRGEAEGSP